MKEELNQSYLNNDMIKSKKSLVEADKQIKILSEREKRYIEESEKLEAQPKQVNLKIENFWENITILKTIMSKMKTV